VAKLVRIFSREVVSGILSTLSIISLDVVGTIEK
jgi:hypothetical protein